MNSFCQAQAAFIMWKAEVSERERFVNLNLYCIIACSDVCDGRVHSDNDRASCFTQAEALGADTCLTGFGYSPYLYFCSFCATDLCSHGITSIFQMFLR